MQGCERLLRPTLQFELPNSLAGRRLIGLGEVTHGSGGLHELSAELMLKMIREFGVTTILFEAPYGVVYELNKRIEKGEEIRPLDMRDLYFNWRSQQSLKFFNQLSQLNREGQQVKLIGIDIRQPARDFAILNSYISAHSLSDSFLKDFPIRDSQVQTFVHYERQILSHHQTISKALSEKLLIELESIKESLGINFDDPTISELIASVRRLASWVRTYTLLSIEEDYDKGFVSRDEGMAEEVMSYLGIAKGPILLWAHLGHLVFNSAQVKSEHSWFSAGDLMGSILKKKLKDQYSTIALMAFSTEVALVSGERKQFIALSNSLESKGPDNPNMVEILGQKELAKMGKVIIGDTTDEQSPVKQTYIKMDICGADQFDFAAIRKSSVALVDVAK